MKHNHFRRMLSLALALVMVLSLGSGVQAAPVKNALTVTELDSVSADLTQGTAIQTNTPAPAFADTDMVRVLIVLEGDGAVSQLKGGENFIENAEAVAYRAELQARQEKLASDISQQALKGEKLDVVWNLTLMANAISANVRYGDIEKIAAVEGVEKVYLEPVYEPMEAEKTNIAAQQMTGANVAQDTYGYTGAGSAVAVVDTGIDTDHQSFDAAAYMQSLILNAEQEGMELDTYLESLDLMDLDHISKVLPQLNAAKRYPGLTAKNVYLNAKLPFNFNYVDGTLNVTHDEDTQGSHGSHVAGIAAANRLIPVGKLYDFEQDGDFDLNDLQAVMDLAVGFGDAWNKRNADADGDGQFTDHDVHLMLDVLENGGFTDAASAVGVTGVAPDAQIITMKVFGVTGGAYASDYMAATEDAMILGCDAVNLSLGGANPGFASSHEYEQAATDYVDGLMERLADSGMVMLVAAGNNGNWADQDDAYGLMYADEGGTYNTSEPATYANALNIASADNTGLVTDRKTWFAKDGAEYEVILEGVSAGVNKDWVTLDDSKTGKTLEAVFVGDPTALFAGEEQTDLSIYGASADDYGDVTGKIVLVARGNQVSFADKHSNGALAGAAGVIIYNNVSDPIYASIEGSEATIPCATMSLADARAVFELFGGREGTFGVHDKLNVIVGAEDAAITMSDFSSWGTTGDLTIKPELTAPGGGIYSVNGVDKDGDAYEAMSGTSMATPHAAGLVALAGQYIRDKGLAEQTGLSQRVLAQSLLMSTAEVLMEGEMPYSVRNQGAGLASIENLILADSYVMVDGQPDGKVKAELGDGTAARSFTFTLHNLTNAEQTYALSAQIMTTGSVEIDGHILATDQMVALPADVHFSTGSTVTVPASGSAEVTVTIAISGETAAEMKAKGFENGFYIEGFVYANAQADAEGAVAASHSIPLLGWYGGWTDISMYEANEHLDWAYNTLERPAHMDNYSTNILSWCPIGYGSGMYYSGNIYGSFNSETGEALGDSRYLEARNAVNSTDAAQWQLFAIYPTLIRNAADHKLTIYNTDDPSEIYYFNDFENTDDYLLASFYYMNYAQWYNQTTETPIDLEGWKFVDQEGNPLPEGTNFTIELAAAPDYYVRDDGTVDWSQVGEGAYQRYSFTVDNTKPQLDGELTLEGDTLNFTVQDDNYIAAVILLTGDASGAVSYCFPDMDEDQRGESYTGTLDLSGYREFFGNKAAIAVCDYAGNERYYAVNLGGEGASYGDLVAFRYDASGYTGSWVAFSEGVQRNETGLFPAGVDMVAAEYVNGLVFAQDNNANLYGIKYSDMLADSVDLEKTFITRLENVYQDFAYNYSDGKLYGLLTGEDNAGYPTTELFTINIRGAYYDADNWTDVAAYQEDWAQSRGGVYGLALAIDDTGSVYILGPNWDADSEQTTDTAHLWKASMETMWGSTYLGAFREVGDTGMGMDYLQSMTWDHNTETLYWAQFYPRSFLSMETNLVRINPANAECEIVGELSYETAGLFAPLSAESAARAEHANVPDFDPTVIPTPMLSLHNLSLGSGKSQQLGVTFDLWYSVSKDVVWSSSDESIATVDQNGLVSAVSDGSCTITVAAADDESKFDECDVTVASLTVSINGIISRTEGGLNSVFGAKLYQYNMLAGTPEMTQGSYFTAEGDLSGYGMNIGSAIEARDSIWACEYGNAGMIYRINKDTGAAEELFMPIDGDVMYGLSYSETTDMFTGIMNYYLYLDLDMSDAMYDQMKGSYDEQKHQFTFHRIDLSQRLAASDEGFLTGESGQGSIVDVVLCGVTNVDNTEGKSYTISADTMGITNYTPDTTLVLLDNVGRLWHIDEITGMTFSQDNYGNRAYTRDDGSMVNADLEDVFTIENTDGTCNVFVIRTIMDTAMTEMYWNGTMPRITYHFSDLYYAGKTEEGAPMYFVSMYDYWNSGATNQLYLYVAPMGTGEYTWDENWNRVEIMSKDALYDLGDTGFGNIIATITSAEVIDGVPPVVMPESVRHLTAGIYRMTETE